MALPSANASNHTQTYSNTFLVPLRVNVVSDDKNTCIVDTILLDRNCWPVPLFYPLEDAVDRNAEELAYTLMSDMEVLGMGRTVRHFTGRMDIWNTSLFHKMVDQLRVQLKHVLKTSKLLPERAAAGNQKRKLMEVAAGNVEAKKSKTEESESKKEGEDAKEESEKSKQEESKESKEENKQQEESEETKQDQQQQQTSVETTKKVKKASLVPIRLRLCVHGVRIHDDFVWDKNLPLCPIEFAQTLGRDLNLSDEAVIAIVTSIVEQLDGAVVDDTKDLDVADPSSSARKNATAAWPMEHKVHIMNMEHIVGLHKPNTS
mgnify:CR=1 FL=1